MADTMQTQVHAWVLQILLLLLAVLSSDGCVGVYFTAKRAECGCEIIPGQCSQNSLSRSHDREWPCYGIVFFMWSGNVREVRRAIRAFGLRTCVSSFVNVFARPCERSRLVSHQLECQGCHGKKWQSTANHNGCDHGDRAFAVCTCRLQWKVPLGHGHDLDRPELCSKMTWTVQLSRQTSHVSRPWRGTWVWRSRRLTWPLCYYWEG